MLAYFWYQPYSEKATNIITNPYFMNSELVKFKERYVCKDMIDYQN